MRLTKDAMLLVDELPNKELVIEKLAATGKLFITREDVLKIIESISRERLPIRAAMQQKPESITAENINHRIEIIEGSDITGNSRATGKVDDFINYFRDRFSRIKAMFMARGITGLVKMSALKDYKDQKVSVIGMVTEMRESKKGNKILELEDEHSNCTVIVSKEDLKSFPSIINDDIILVTGKVFNELLIATEIEFPDISIYRETPKITEDIGIAYVSDLHFASNKHLGKAMNQFAEWLGKSDMGKQIAYLVVAGDVVDGIGIYPKQEKELTVKDIEQQYKLFEEFCSKIPDWIKIIVSPGNHDGVRRGEPQPSIPKDLIPSYAITVSSPVYAKLHGLTHLIYHGSSMDSMIATIPGMTYNQPELCMKEYLKRRHLSPIYGENQIVPEKKDYLVVDPIPDVFHAGHVHKNGYTKYRGCLVVNSGTFQDRTEYQEMLGHIPTPGVVPVFFPATNSLREVNFMRDNVES